jgi:hypothetical protein
LTHAGLRRRRDRLARVGANVVRRLVAQRHEAVPASPATGVDTVTGVGLADVMVGDAGVGHHLAVSTVGADRLPDNGCLRAKVAQEVEIEDGTRWALPG